MVVRNDALETFQAANGKLCLELCISKGKRMLLLYHVFKKKERKGTLTVT